MATICDRRSVGKLRVYRPAATDVGALLWEDQQQDRSLLLGKIQHHYKAALDRLTVKWRADMLACFLGGGICIGLLDPTSNIIANTLLVGEAAISRAEVLTGIVDRAKLRDMERRSGDGLIAFLICFFPYLTDWEAVHYLLLAEADLLVAARIVVEDRSMRSLRFDSAATESVLKLALRCAALAARHPWAVQLAGTWVSLSHHLHKSALVLSSLRCHFSHDTVCSFYSLFNETIATSPHLLRPWKLATDRSKVIKVPYEHSRSLRRVLLDMIHGFYLQALARMPTDKLRSHYQRSLIKVGHCYGPLDPVSSIILNTIWYDAAFPPPIPEAELYMLGTMSLMRIEGQSFYGLVSFLCTRDHNLNLHQALQFLLETDLNLPLADPSLEAAVPPPRSTAVSKKPSWLPASPHCTPKGMRK